MYDDRKCTYFLRAVLLHYETNAQKHYLTVVQCNRTNNGTKETCRWQVIKDLYCPRKLRLRRSLSKINTPLVNSTIRLENRYTLLETQLPLTLVNWFNVQLDGCLHLIRLISQGIAVKWFIDYNYTLLPTSTPWNLWKFIYHIIREVLRRKRYPSTALKVLINETNNSSSLAHATS